jgi:hypothetical protein
MCQPSEERGALEMGNQLTSTLQALALKPSLNPQQISPNQGQGGVKRGVNEFRVVAGRKWAREREKGKGGGGFYTPSHRKEPL